MSGRDGDQDGAASPHRSDDRLTKLFDSLRSRPDPPDAATVLEAVKGRLFGGADPDEDDWLAEIARREPVWRPDPGDHGAR